VDIQMTEKKLHLWSWVNQPASLRKKAAGPGRYSRPPAIRDAMVAKAFGEELRRLREARNLTAAELGSMIGVSKPFILQLEASGRKNVALHQLFDLAEALGTSVRDIVAVCESAVAEYEAYLLKYGHPPSNTASRNSGSES
jgi:DNA-binding XRE family transcriptional regulator